MSDDKKYGNLQAGETSIYVETNEEKVNLDRPIQALRNVLKQELQDDLDKTRLGRKLSRDFQAAIAILEAIQKNG